MNFPEREFSDTFSILTNFENPVKIAVAFSGGCDSLALLALCARLVGPENVRAVYVNHRLRSEEELEAEIDLNRKNCLRLGTELEVIDLGMDSVKKTALERKGGTEEAARFLRYRVLADFCREHGCGFLATAHHRNDQVETVLMRLLRKSPVTSLCGIRETGQVNGVRLIRPLLEFSREQLEEFVRSLGLEWSTDSTNSDTGYSRNRIRNEVLPALKEIMPDCEERLLGIRAAAVRACSGLYIVDTDRLETRAFMNLSAAHRTAVLFSMWDSVMGTQLPQTLIERVCTAAACVYTTGKTCVCAANGGAFTVSPAEIMLTSAKNGEGKGFSAELPLEGVLELPYGLVVLTGGEADRMAARLDFSLFEGTPKVRFAENGDSIHLKEGTKTVLKLLKDMKIPAVLRNRVPVIEDNSGVCAVLGMSQGGRDRVAARFLSDNWTELTAVRVISAAELSVPL